MTKLNKLIQIIFILNALIWLGIGILSVSRLSNPSSIPQTVLIALTILTFINALGMLAGGIGILTPSRLYFPFVLAFLAFNIILTFTDEFGLLDFITLVIDLVLVGLLIVSRKSLSPV